MSKVIIHASIPVDGYTAGVNDDMSWMAEYIDPNALAGVMVKNVGALDGSYSTMRPYCSAKASACSIRPLQGGLSSSGWKWWTKRR